MSVYKTWHEIDERLWTDGFAQWQQWWFEQLAEKDRVKVTFTPNPEQVVQAAQRRDYKKVLLEADTLIPDGVGLQWARRKARDSMTESFERFTGVDVVQWWGTEGLRQFLQGKSKREPVPVTVLLGAQPGVAERLAHQWNTEHSFKNPAFFGLHGYTNAAELSGNDLSADFLFEDATVLRQLRELQPQVLFVAFGAPTQELWVKHHRRALTQMGVRHVVVCGGAFDVLVGDIPRAPEWLRNGGGEWVFRLIQQPSRWYRQLRLVLFVAAILLGVARKSK